MIFLICMICMSRVDLQSCVQRWKLNREIVKLKVRRFSSAQAGMLKIFENGRKIRIFYKQKRQWQVMALAQTKVQTKAWLGMWRNIG